MKKRIAKFVILNGLSFFATLFVLAMMVIVVVGFSSMVMHVYDKINMDAEDAVIAVFFFMLVLALFYIVKQFLYDKILKIIAHHQNNNHEAFTEQS